MNTVPVDTIDIQHGHTLDLRKMNPGERSLRLMTAFESARPGATLLLVTAWPPSALQRQFQIELKGRFVWKTVQDGPEFWRVLITKTKNGKP